MWGKAISVLCAVFMAALCLCPCINGTNDAYASEPASRTTDGFDFATLKDWSRDPVAIGLTGIGGALFLVGYLYGHDPSGADHSVIIPEPSPQPTDSDTVMSDYYRMEAEKTQLVLSRTATDYSATMGLDSNTWHFTNAYWQRSVELVAASEWDAAKDFDSNVILRKADVYTNMSNLYYSWQAVADSAFYTEKDNRAIWTSMGYDVNMGWNGICNGSGLVYPDFCSYCVPTSEANLVFIDTDLPSDACDGTSSTIYVIGAGGKLTYQDGTEYALSSGRNDIRNLSTGIYALGEGCCYAGSMVPVDGGADLTGAAVLIDGSDFAVAIPSDTGYSVISTNGSSAAAEWVGYTIRYDDGKEFGVGISDVIAKWDGMISEFEYTVSRCTLAGSNAWRIYDSVGEATQAVSLSAILPDIEGTTLSDEQAYALSVLAMIEMSEFFDSNRTDITADDLKASAESLEMVCHGKIIDPNGAAIAEDVIFTPFNYVNDQMLSVHSQVSWDQPGFALVWAKGDYDSWNGDASPSDMKLITLTKGFKMDIDTIIIHDTPVDATVLEIRQMDKILSDIYNAHTAPPDLPEFADWSIYAKLLFVIVGAIVIVMGVRFRNIWVLIIGAAIAALGWFFGGNIMSLLYEWFGIGRMR